MKANPREIDEEWDEYWTNRLLFYFEAQAMANDLK